MNRRFDFYRRTYIVNELFFNCSRLEFRHVSDISTLGYFTFALSMFRTHSAFPVGGNQRNFLVLTNISFMHAIIAKISQAIVKASCPGRVDSQGFLRNIHRTACPGTTNTDPSWRPAGGPLLALLPSYGDLSVTSILRAVYMTVQVNHLKHFGNLN